MADFRLLNGQTGISFVESTFVINREKPTDIALWGGGPNGESLFVKAEDSKVIEVTDLSYVTLPPGDNLRRIKLAAKSYGMTYLIGTVGSAGGAEWARAKIAVEGTVIAQGDMGLAPDAPMFGSIPVAVGAASVVRIPVPGTKGLAIELTPRGWTPKGGSTSTLFIQDVSGKRNLRLDYGYNVKTKTVNFHWNQKGTFNEFGIADHAVAGSKGSSLYSGAKYFRYGGRVLLVVGAAIDIYSIVVSSSPLRQATKVAAGWVGAWAGCKTIGAAGAAAGTFVEPGGGTAIGGIVGCAVGGFIGYVGFSEGAGLIYDWADGTIFTPIPASATP